MGETTGHWHTAFCFDTLCHLAYMIYITNANAGINIVSITSSYKEYRLFLLTIHRRVLQRSHHPTDGWDGVEFEQLILRKSLNVATKCQIQGLKCTKIDFRWGSAPDHAGGSQSTSFV